MPITLADVTGKTQIQAMQSRILSKENAELRVKLDNCRRANKALLGTCLAFLLTIGFLLFYGV